MIGGLLLGGKGGGAMSGACVGTYSEELSLAALLGLEKQSNVKAKVIDSTCFQKHKLVQIK